MKKANYAYVISAGVILFLFCVFALRTQIEFNQLTENNNLLSYSQETLNTGWMFILFIITETVSFPYGALTAFLLVYIFSRLLKLSFKQSLLLFFIVGFIILFGLESKSLIKKITSEPRPYMIWLSTFAEPIKLNLPEYYAMTDRETQKSLLSNIIAQPVFAKWEPQSWLIHHWIKDNEYSFPSGHTFYATLFALLGCGLFAKKHKWFAFGLMSWAILVMLSRLFLGMHRPVDLMGGLGIAFVCAIIGVVLINKFILTPSITNPFQNSQRRPKNKFR